MTQEEKNAQTRKVVAKGGTRRRPRSKKAV